MITPARQALEATACSLACAPGLCHAKGHAKLIVRHDRNVAGNRFFAAKTACGAAGDARTRAVHVAASSLWCRCAGGVERWLSITLRPA